MRLKRMPPNQSSFIMSSVTLEPVSRTYQYRKVMKPMLERKRRARINRCLDELKELMTGTLQSEGENVAKLEKADILELTVRHLHNLRKQNSLLFQSDQIYADRFWAGFRHCATEVSHFLSGVDQQASVCLLKHMNAFIKKVETTQILHPQHQQSQPMSPSEGPSTHQLLGHPSMIHPPMSSNSSNLPNDLTVIRIPPPAAIPVSLQRPWHKTCMPKDEGGVWRPW